MNKRLTNSQKRKKKIDKKRKKKAIWSDKCVEKLIEEASKLAEKNIAEAKAKAGENNGK